MTHLFTSAPELWELPATKKPHTRSWIMRTMRRECAQHQCTTMPTYGTAQSKKPEYCAKHKHPGMVDVLNRRCGH
ncbi:unnamed protein product [Ectocarpus sp. CCAP 1310/34]|nr:unnamed protein product [Ectocarpus sp. CCAP 1310/34]